MASSKQDRLLEHIAQIEIGIREIGSQLDSPLIAADSLIQLSLQAHDNTKIVMGLGIIRA